MINLYVHFVFSGGARGEKVFTSMVLNCDNINDNVHLLYKLLKICLNNLCCEDYYGR